MTEVVNETLWTFWARLSGERPDVVEACFRALKHVQEDGPADLDLETWVTRTMRRSGIAERSIYNILVAMEDCPDTPVDLWIAQWLRRAGLWV